MYLLIEIRDGSHPARLDENTFVDLSSFDCIDQAIIAAEPQHMDSEGFVVVSRDGEFGIVPKVETSQIPALTQKWHDKKLAQFFFIRFETLRC